MEGMCMNRFIYASSVILPDFIASFTESGNTLFDPFPEGAAGS
jgi:hypothetical protein